MVAGFLEACAAGPVALLLEGEAGIGKTTLWKSGVAEALARRYRVLACRPAGTETALSFSALGDLLAGVVEETLRVLPGPRRRALEVALVLEELEGGPLDQRAVALAFLDTIRLLASAGPVLVAVDDVHWIDAASASVLEFAARRLGEEPIGFLLSRRAESAERALLGLDRALSDRFGRVPVGPLSLGALHQLLRTRLGRPLPRPLLRRVHAASGGNPFFALEIGRALERHGVDLGAGEELPIPSTLEELLHERLDGLSGAAREVVQVAAALAEPTARLVEAACSRRARRGLSEALGAGVLEVDGEQLRFAHPLLGAAVASRSTPTERRSLHARLAELVPGAEERARHLALASAGPSREPASALEHAARAAYARGAPAAAAELAEHALRLTPGSDVEDVRRRVLFAADRLDQAGDSRRAIALLEEARAAAPPGPARAAVLVHLMDPTWHIHGVGEALALGREAVAEAAGDDALEATIHLELVDVMRFVEGASTDHGLAHSERALAAAERTGDPKLRYMALAAFGLQQFIVGRGVPRKEMEEALALERSLGGPPFTYATWSVCHQLAWSGEDVEGARRRLHDYRDAMRARDDFEELHPLSWLTVLEWRAGNWELAARYAAELVALIAQMGSEAELSVADVASALVAAHCGQLDVARARAQQALERDRRLGVRSGESRHLWVLGFIDLSLGDPAAALERLRPAWEIRDALGYFEPGHRLELADTLEALIAVGELDEAERLLAPWEGRAAALDRAWALAVTARYRALLFAARGDLAGALRRFDEALAEHARSVYPFEHGRTLLALGVTQRRGKQRAAARATLEQALSIFEQLGAPLWAAKARAELARIGGRAPTRGELTRTELQVAELVAEGRTNREVAAALFVSEHTVESHLRGVYRKLGVRSRTQLAHRLSELSAHAAARS